MPRKMLVVAFALALSTVVGRAQSTPPAYCSPCLYYSGDYDQNSREGNAYANELTPFTGVETFVPVTVPGGQSWQVTGLIFNSTAVNGGILDPQMAAWSIRSGMGPGVGGKIVLAGKSPAIVTAHDSFLYAVEVDLPSPAIMLGNTTYWINVTPECTNLMDTACSGYPQGIFFVANTDGLNAYPSLQTGNGGKGLWWGVEGIVANYEPLCQVQPIGCQNMSFGLIGNLM